MRSFILFAIVATATRVNGFTTSPSNIGRRYVMPTYTSVTSPFRMKPLALSPPIVDPLIVTATAPSSGGSLDPLLTYFLQTLITNGVPALFSIVVFAFLAWQLRSVSSNNENQRARNTSPLALLYDDLYGDQEQEPFNKKGNGFFSRRNLRGPYDLPKNTGVPKLQYIQVTHLNPKYDSYQYSITAKTQSKAAAAQQYRQSAWERAWGKAIAAESLTPHQLQSLQQAEQEFLQEALRKQQDIQVVTAALQRNAVDESMKKQLGMESVYQLDPPTTSSPNETTAVESSSANPQFDWNSRKKKASTSTLATLQAELMQMELKFLQKILGIVGPTHAAALRTALLGQGGEGLATSLLASRPLSRLLVGDENTSTKKNVYVVRFPGDLNASQVANLREEITAILQSGPRPGIDEVVLILQTGGGTVTGYGLAAAQLQRLKKAQLRLTIAVEQVAASGGYMMACIADHIVASPFAVLGSIGVISDIPNVYERLKNEGIEFQTVTAGKYKRTLTPTKKVTKEDFQKSKEDIESVFNLFRDFVRENRPQLDIEKVATGETWFGTAALERGLCDEIQTVDDLLLERIQEGCDVYEVRYKPPVLENSVVDRLLQPATSTGESGPIRSAIRWLVQLVATEIKEEMLNASQKDLTSPQSKYMAVDDTADQIRSQLD